MLCISNAQSAFNKGIRDLFNSILISSENFQFFLFLTLDFAIKTWLSLRRKLNDLWLQMLGKQFNGYNYFSVMDIGILYER